MQSRHVYLTLIVLGIVLIVFFSNTSNNKVSSSFNENNWYSYEEGLEIAKKESKPMFIFISSPTCPLCRKMKEDVFSDPEVIDYIKSNFVPVYVDISREKPPFNVFSYPTFIIFENNSVVDSWTGYASKKLFLKKLKSVNV